MKQPVEQLSLVDLAKETGLPGRTIRFYIARGLLPRPMKGGRAAAYGPEHRTRLEEIQQLQKQGLTLSEIGGRLSGVAAAGVPEPMVWAEYRLAEDVVVRVRADAGPWRLKRVRDWLAQCPTDAAAADEKQNQ
jgi:DNA-binding transcriptional MerR regulator